MKKRISVSVDEKLLAKVKDLEKKTLCTGQRVSELAEAALYAYAVVLDQAESPLDALCDSHKLLARIMMTGGRTP